MSGARKSGVLVVDKPRGLTSHDVVARLRKRLGTREIGHAGTLDPMATGVLVVAVGEATKLVPYLTSEEKSYEAEVTFGRATDTLDADGAVVAEGPVPDDLAARLAEALEEERARDQQIPPAYSAIHTGGERAHERARRGEAVTLAPRAVSVIELVCHEVAATSARLSLRVSKGYYVRSLARDLGERVGAPSHLSALRRTASGSFVLAEARPLEAVASDTPLLSLPEAAARVLPLVTLTDRATADARAGRRVELGELSASPAGFSAWLDPSGALVAIGEIGDEGGRVIRGFQG